MATPFDPEKVEQSLRDEFRYMATTLAKVMIADKTSPPSKERRVALAKISRLTKQLRDEVDAAHILG